MDAAYSLPIVDRGDDGNTNQNDSSSSGTSSIEYPDLNASLASASSSFWGLVSTATNTIKKTTASVVSEVRRDLSEFNSQLHQERSDLFVDPLASSTTSQTVSRQSTGGSTASIASSTSGSGLASPSSAASSSSSLSSSTSGDEWSATAGRVLGNVERIGDNMLNKAINFLPAAIWSFGEDSQQATPEDEQRIGIRPSSSPQPATPSQQQSSYPSLSVKQSKLYALESNPATYTTDPTDANGVVTSEYRAFAKHFDTDYAMWREELETKIIPGLSQSVREMYQLLVENESSTNERVPEKLFYCRYLYRVRLIEAEEARRIALLGKIAQVDTKASNEDSWGDEDEDEVALNDKPSEKPTTTATVVRKAEPIVSPASSSTSSTPSISSMSPSPFVPVVASTASASPVAFSSPETPVITTPIIVQPVKSVTIPATSASKPVVKTVEPITPLKPVQPKAETPLLATPSPAVESSPPPATAVLPTASTPITPITPLIASASASPPPASTTVAPSSASKKAPETKEAMRERLQQEARERVAQKLAEKKQLLQKEREKKEREKLAAANNSTATSSVASTASSIPPAHPSTSVSPEAEQVATLTAGFSDLITNSIPTNTTPEPVRRHLESQKLAEAKSKTVVNASAASSSSSAAIGGDAHLVTAPSSPISTSSRASSGESGKSQSDWENVDDSKSLSSASSNSHLPQLIEKPAAVPSTTTKATSKEEEWDSWE